MARYLLCPDCNGRRKLLAAKFKELYESVAGKSKGEYFCDGCFPSEPIHVGDLCYSAVELPNKEHFNYEFHKPAAWMNDFLIPV